MYETIFLPCDDLRPAIRDLRKASIGWSGPVTVVHDGRAYMLADLFHALTPEEQAVVEQTAPRSFQEAWDEVVRRWPALAAKIAAVAVPLD